MTQPNDGYFLNFLSFGGQRSKVNLGTNYHLPSKVIGQGGRANVQATSC